MIQCFWALICAGLAHELFRLSKTSPKPHLLDSNVEEHSLVWPRLVKQTHKIGTRWLYACMCGTNSQGNVLFSRMARMEQKLF